MKTKTSFVIFFSLFLTVNMLSAQPEIKPYSVETTFQKLKKDYPFISPIQDLNSDNISFEENVVYREIDGHSLKADIYFPKNSKQKVFPAVLLIHGGGWVSGSKDNQRVMAQHLAENGFVAIAASYRLSREAKYPAAVLDLKAAIRWMKENSEKYKIDPDKIAVLGASAGAQLATLLGVTPNSERFNESNNQISDEVQAIVNIDGIVSFIHPEAEESEIAGLWLGGLQSGNPENWKAASPLEYVNEKNPPTLFINSAQPRFHAGRDDFIEILDQNGIYNEVHTLPETPHSFWLMHPWFETTLHYTVSFLNKTFSENFQNINKIYREIIVSKDGNGEFETIQEAINSTRDLGPGQVVIHIKNGIYNEKITIPSWKTKITLKGVNREKTIIFNDDFSGKTNPETGADFSTFNSYTVLVQGNDIKIENLTIENTSCGEGQAVALHVEGDRFVIKNSNILGCQDTIYAATENSRQFYENCYIEGTTDFIFGEATAVFQNCEIKSLKDSYITAAATTPNQEYGFVFLNCKLTAAEGVSKVYLGRPWRPFAKTVFIETNLSNHISPEGWDPWHGDVMFPDKEKTTFYAEYNNSGESASAEARVKWSRQLNAEEAAIYTIENILKGHDNWYPLRKED